MTVERMLHGLMLIVMIVFGMSILNRMDAIEQSNISGAVTESSGEIILAKITELEAAIQPVDIAFPTTQRGIGIATHRIMLGQDKETVLKEVKNLEKVIVKEEVTRGWYVLHNRYAGQMVSVVRSGHTELTLYDEWKINFTNKDSQYLTRFKEDLYLAHDYEILPLPQECPQFPASIENSVEQLVPQLMYYKASRNGAVWESDPEIVRLDPQSAYALRFNQKSAEDIRVGVMIYCVTGAQLFAANNTAG